MTTNKQLKARIRERMADTGEKYADARRHLLNAIPPSDYQLRGGIHPETASLTSVLANRGIYDPTTDEPISEAMILGIGGGLGAGYILWEFEQGASRIVTTGFRNQWQYPQKWVVKTLDRLGLDHRMVETGSVKKAAAELTEALADNQPAVVSINMSDLPYWHLSEGSSGYPLAIYGQDGDRLLVDDRNDRRLTIDGPELAAARKTIPSYKQRIVVVDAAATEIETQTLIEAVERGIADQIAHLSEKSDSFSIPAFRKWARMLVDEKNKKAWRKVFADRRALWGALLSTYEAVMPVGILGGNLRDLYADFLDDAARLLDDPVLVDAAEQYRQAAARWVDFAETCVGASDPLGQAVALTVERRAAVSDGDAGLERARVAAEALDAMRAQYNGEFPLSTAELHDLFDRMSEALVAVADTEERALAALTARG